MTDIIILAWQTGVSVSFTHAKFHLAPQSRVPYNNVILALFMYEQR
jgi:hypothetical protein